MCQFFKGRQFLEFYLLTYRIKPFLNRVCSKENNLPLVEQIVSSRVDSHWKGTQKWKWLSCVRLEYTHSPLIRLQDPIVWSVTLFSQQYVNTEECRALVIAEGAGGGAGFRRITEKCCQCKYYKPSVRTTWMRHFQWGLIVYDLVGYEQKLS